MDAKMKYKYLPANIKKMIRKNKKLNKKIDVVQGPISQYPAEVA